MATGRESIVIANCGGFWGDDPTAARRQVDGGPVDYLVMDYLAEVTMAILQKQRERDDCAGYARDFLLQLGDVLAPSVERGIKIITNAGGVNPAGCAAAVQRLAEELGVADRVNIAVIEGDNLQPQLDSVLDAGEELVNLDTGVRLRDAASSVLSANVYIGAAPIVAALEMGATIVIAGRVTDTAVTLAPMIYEFGWRTDDWDRLAAGIIAGHIIECGAQCTGGNFTDWQEVPSFAEMGYPLVEAHRDGTFVVTKHPGTGGLVSVNTVSEQLLYEMGSPAYLSPDCIALFDSIRLAREAPDRVRVSGVRGLPPPEKLKVAITFAKGWRSIGRLTIGGPNALAKARRAAEIVWESAGGQELYDEASTAFIGWDACHPPLGDGEPGEVLLQLAVRDQDRSKIDSRFCPMVVGRSLGSVPGMTVPSDQGRPRTSQVLGHWPALISRDEVTINVSVGTERRVVDAQAHLTTSGLPEPTGSVSPVGAATADPDSRVVPLISLCLGRSGDKGDTANVGLIARSAPIFAWMIERLTTDVIAKYFEGVCEGPVERFELPNLGALNFLLHRTLGGGGSLSLRFDPQGKTFAQYLLAMPVEVPAALVPHR